MCTIVALDSHPYNFASFQHSIDNLLVDYPKITAIMFETVIKSVKWMRHLWIGGEGCPGKVDLSGR